MNEEPTKGLPDKRSFEKRVFARFDTIDARFDTVDARLEKLESRAYDTKPIWERALAKIMEMDMEVGEIKTKCALIETEVVTMKTDYAGIRNELSAMKHDLKHQVNKRLDLILEFLLEGRSDLRDAEDRIKQLEMKLA